MGARRLRHRNRGCFMSKSDVTILAAKVILGLVVVEQITTIAFELSGRTHSTPVWLAGIIAGSITLILRASFKEKK